MIFSHLYQLRGKKLRLKKKTNVFDIFFVQKFLSFGNFQKNSLFSISFQLEEEEKNIMKSFWPIVIKNKVIIVVPGFCDEKCGLDSDENFLNKSVIKISKIVKLFSFIKNIKRKIVIFFTTKDMSSLCGLLNFFQKKEHRTKVKFLFISDDKNSKIFTEKFRIIGKKCTNFYLTQFFSRNFSFLIKEKENLFRDNLEKSIGKPMTGKSIVIFDSLREDQKLLERLHLLGFSSNDLINL